MTRWVPLVIVAVILAGLLTLIIVPFVTGRRRMRLDRFKTMRAGGLASGQITQIETARGRDISTVSVSFCPSPDGPTVLANQKSSPAALLATGYRVGSTVAVRFDPKRPRWGFIDALARAELGAPPDSTPEPPAVFYISCTVSPAAGRIANAGMNFGCVGGAQLVIDATGVTLAGTRPRPFRSAASVLRRVALENVVDVERHGDLVQLVVQEQDYATKLLFRALDIDDANRIAARLPTTRTSHFVPEMAEHAEFSKSLLSISPETPVTHVLLWINVAAFILCVILGGAVIGFNAPLLVRLGTNYTPLTLDGQWWRLVTSMFLHFGLLHLAFNMLALYVNGSVAERIFGSLRYAVIYMASGIGGSVASLLWHSQANAAGASGAIFGILGAMIAFFARNEAGVPRSVVKTQLKSAGVFVVYNLLMGASSHRIDNAAHVGGLIGGLITGFLLSRPLQADRAEKDWTRQWLIAVSAMAVACLGAVYLISHNANPVVRTFGGVKLRTPIEQLIKARGQPIHREGMGYVFNTIDSRHNGVISVVLASEKEGLVRAVVYDGDRESAPSELPYLRGMTRDQVVKQCAPVRASKFDEGREWIYFENGVEVIMLDAHVTTYGVYDSFN